MSYTFSARTRSRNEKANTTAVVNHTTRTHMENNNPDINPDIENIELINRDVKEFYRELFEESAKKFDSKKGRKTRDKINDYETHVSTKVNSKHSYETLFAIGDLTQNDDPEIVARKTAALSEYFESFQERNGNSLKVFNATIHLDEANPHLHIHWIPVHKTPDKALEVRNSSTGAFKTLVNERNLQWGDWVHDYLVKNEKLENNNEQFEDGKIEYQKKATVLYKSDYSLWLANERKIMSEIMGENNLEYLFKKTKKRDYQEVDEYKEIQKKLDVVKENLENLEEAFEDKHGEYSLKIQEIKKIHDSTMSEMREFVQKSSVEAKSWNSKVNTLKSQNQSLREQNKEYESMKSLNEELAFKYADSEEEIKETLDWLDSMKHGDSILLAVKEVFGKVEASSFYSSLPKVAKQVLEATKRSDYWEDIPKQFGIINRNIERNKIPSLTDALEDEGIEVVESLKTITKRMKSR